MDDVVGQPAGLASAWLTTKGIVPQTSVCKEPEEGRSDAGAAGTAGSDAEMRRRRRMWHSVALGQVLSVLIALMSMSAASLDDRGVNLPSFVNFINYSLITISFVGPMLVRRRSLGLPWWRYAVYALVDVEANAMTVLAYRFTSITSVTMLDAVSIPSVMVLSRLFLRARYTSKHLAGVGLCLMGLALTVMSDLFKKKAEDGHPHAVKGDLICILGAALYGASNVMQENFVKNHDRVEFLGMAGAFGVVISGVQTAALEWNTLSEVTWTNEVVLFIIGYSFSLFVLYCWTSLFLQAGDAALFNLSLLTADLYAFIFALEVENTSTSFLFFIAAAIIFAGVIVYHSQPPTTLSTAELAQLPSRHDLPGSGRGGAGVECSAAIRGFQLSSFVELHDDASDGLSLTSTSYGSEYGSDLAPGSVSSSPKVMMNLL